MAKTDKIVSETDTQNDVIENAVVPKEENVKRFEGITDFVYAGPSLPNGRLKKYTVLNGTYEKITEYYKEAIEEYPDIKRLIVPSTRFAETRDKTETSGNGLYNCYNKIVREIKAKGDK